jgi:hypothetical protein
MVFVALVASGIVISISTCLNVWDHATEAAETNQEARGILDMLSHDIQTTYLGLDGKTGYVLGESPPAGEPPVDALELSAQSSAVSRLALLPDEMLPQWDDPGRPPVTDYVVVRYEWRAKQTDAPAGLYRMVSVVPTARSLEEIDAGEPTAYEVSSELISASVVELYYQYYDGQNQVWVSNWDTSADRSLPLVAISVELSLRDAHDRDHVFKTTIPIATS